MVAERRIPTVGANSEILGFLSGSNALQFVDGEKFVVAEGGIHPGEANAQVFCPLSVANGLGFFRR